jgi:hypothetical protein
MEATTMNATFDLRRRIVERISEECTNRSEIATRLDFVAEVLPELPPRAGAPR